VRDSLRTDILEGTLKAGEQLTQEELARRFDTSRIPVREALRQLEAEGLVTYLPNRGAIVSAPTIAEIIELFEIRIALECCALRLAVPNMTELDLGPAEEVLRQYDKESDPARWGEMNWRFHSLLYAPCEKPRLLSMINANYGNIGRFTRSRVSRAAGREKPQEQHYELLRLVTEKNAEDAVKLLAEHIQYSQKMLQHSLRSEMITK
jgi:DNA-binding GntR family transcriptional regulator